MINLTPHAITIRTTSGDVTIQPSGVVARVATIDAVVGQITVGWLCQHSGEILPVPVSGYEVELTTDLVETQFGNVIGLPEDTNTPVLVSALVLGAVKGRPNTFAPDTGDTAVRNEKGQIVAVTRLKRA